MIEELENWYLSNCNEDWEHQFGITIETLDNPGWQVEIDLEGTKLDASYFEETINIESELEWIRCNVVNKKFIGSGGPKELNNIINVFIFTWKTTV